MFFSISKTVETLLLSSMSNAVVNIISVSPRVSQILFTASTCLSLASQLLLLEFHTYDSLQRIVLNVLEPSCMQWEKP